MEASNSQRAERWWLGRRTNIGTDSVVSGEWEPGFCGLHQTTQTSVVTIHSTEKLSVFSPLSTMISYGFQKLFSSIRVPDLLCYNVFVCAY